MSSSVQTAAQAGGQLPGASTAHATADISQTTQVPFLIREPLYAPTNLGFGTSSSSPASNPNSPSSSINYYGDLNIYNSSNGGGIAANPAAKMAAATASSIKSTNPHITPPAVSEMFEVARIHHDDGELERSVEVYGLALAKWEEIGAEQRLLENGVNKEQVEQQRVDFHHQANQAIDQITAQVHSAHSVMSGEDKEAEIAREVQSWEEREEQLMQSIAERQAEALSCGVHALVPVEGRIYFHLAVGSVFDTAGHDERALREYLEALKLLRERVPVFHMQLMTATVYTCLGIVYFHLSQYDFAADYFFRALEIREENLPPGHVDVGATLNNVGATLIALNRVSDSLVLFAKAREIFESQLPAHHSRRWILKMNEELAKRRGISTDAVFHPVPFESCKPPMIAGARKIVVTRGMAEMQKEAEAASKLKEAQKKR